MKGTTYPGTKIYTCRRFLPWLTAICLLIMSGGCTRNNGDIGYWFGRWQIMEIYADSEPQADYDGSIFMEFQNNIIRLVWLAPDGYDHSTAICFGTWSQPSDNSLEIDFTHSDDKGRLHYQPFDQTNFPDNAPFVMSISEHSGNNITMTYTDPETSTIYTYRIRKR